MTASRKNTRPSLSIRPASDLVRVDAHVIQPHEYDDLPDMSDRALSEGVFKAKGVPVMGRPPIGVRSKKQITVRLDPSIIDAFKATGPGWQGRINDALAAAAKDLKPTL